ncbi:MAG: putative LPS assembly protein LptD [Bacteroidota bacterium]
MAIFPRPQLSLGALLFCLLFVGKLCAQVDTTRNESLLIEGQDTLRLTSDRLDSLNVALFDSTAVLDTTVADTLIPRDPKQALQDSLKEISELKSAITYKARDSIVFDFKKNMLFLYGAVEMNYESIVLKAERVRVEWEIQTMFAEGVEDSTGQLVGTPEFTEGGQTYNAREMSYNFKSQKGIVRGGRTTQADGYVIGNVAKRQPDGSFHIRRGAFTTCDAEHPHFRIQSSKLKIIPDDKIVSGPLNLVVGNFPLPVALPFGFFPNKKERTNGLLLPQYGEAPDRGFFLQGLGYYVGLNDYIDLEIRGDIYTKGGWQIAGASRYRKLYQYNGSVNVQYGIQRFGESRDGFTDPDFTESRGWKLRWNHTQPINPNTNFNANVNISSTRFLRQISFDQGDVLTNNLNSSVSFTKTFANSPFSMTLGMNHSQDVNKNLVSVELPSLNLQMNRRSPFRGIREGDMPEALNAIGVTDFLKNLGINYNLTARNQLSNVPDSSFFDVLFNPADSIEIFDETDSVFVRVPARQYISNGLRHQSSVSTNIRVLNYINVSPGFSYNEYWYFETLQRVYNRAEGTTEDFNVPGFAAARDYNFNISANTTFYGLYELLGSRRERKIRQQIIPTIGYNFRPDFAEERFGYYREVQSNRNGDTQTYNRFQNGTFGSPSQGESRSMNFGINNVFEMKYRKKESYEEDFPEEEDKYERVRLLDALGVSSSYNFAADSFRLQPFNLTARTQLLNNKLNINAGASLDPYVLEGDIEDPNDAGRRVDRLVWNETGGLGRITRANVSLTTSLRSTEFGKNKEGEEQDEAGDDFRQDLNQVFNYVDFEIPWSLRLSYNLQYSKPNLLEPTITQTARIGGDFNFTEKWKIGFQSGYDFRAKEVTLTTLNIYRDLHCWEMSFQVTPFGPLQSYSLAINVKSSTLKDLRLTRRNDWQNRRP